MVDDFDLRGKRTARITPMTTPGRMWRAPGRHGMYLPQNERDACGVGFVAHTGNAPSHRAIQMGLQMLENLTHRGAVGANPTTGDGAGMLVQIPDAFFRQFAQLPPNITTTNTHNARNAGDRNNDQNNPRNARNGNAGDRNNGRPDNHLRERDNRNAGDAGASEERAYGVAMLFLPQDKSCRAAIERLTEQIVTDEGMRPITWRTVPTNRAAINDEVAASAPVVRQLFIARGKRPAGDDFERQLFIARKRLERAVAESADANARANPAAVTGNETAADPNVESAAGSESANIRSAIRSARGGGAAADPAGFYCASMSSRTIVYKGMFLSEQLAAYYPDLRDPKFASAMAVVHQRFSTNTFPAWKLAHPYRFIAHNGEINTLRGNINNMTARQRALVAPRFGADWSKLLPLMQHGQSDTATLDNAVELLRLAGYSLAETMAILIPEAWQNNPRLPAELRDFYRYHAPMMEPWDGPAEVVSADGQQIVAVLDRNGLRPGRYWLTDDDWIIMSSEAGVLDVGDAKISHKWRIQPGKILLVDLAKKQLVSDDDVKSQLARKRPYGEWADASQKELDVTAADAAADGAATMAPAQLLRCQQRFGWTQEDLKFIIAPMVADGAEPVGSMGDDAPLSALSENMKPLSWYFRQEFAQVTNPPIDPIREEMVMSLNTYVGARPNLLTPGAPPDTVCVALNHPILTTAQFAALRADAALNSLTVDITYGEDDTLASAIERICAEAARAVASGSRLIILSDASASDSRIAAPILLAASAAHHRLVGDGGRAQTGLVAHTGAARSVHDMATLIGFGVEAICPYLAYESALTAEVDAAKAAALTPVARVANYRKALGKGLMKVMSKMGIATVQSYCGAQIFEAVGLCQDLIDRYFCGAVSQIGGLGIGELERESRFWHGVARNDPPNPLYTDMLAAGGDFAYRIRGEAHLWSPDSIAALQHAVRGNSAAKYSEYARLINQQSERLMTLRGMLEIRSPNPPVPLAEVEPAADIVCRFSTGAMSFGSLSYEAHSTLAVAMNRIGGKSNTGEGGEQAARFERMANGDSARSAIKQVASGRFGVTAEYLANSDMMQIKIAQGAKPGEGGQLPGHKVDKHIAEVRHSVAGVGLISPPPHHDIYSIEDIAQLIFDLKCANPRGQVSVKLVSRCGVGTVAAGVAKAKSDHITISGYDGGTGASPLSSIKHAGTPWELGLSETHQTLVLNDLRGRVALQVDGQIKTGRDVVIGALLGADEFGFATAPLVAEGCIMMRKCHLNTCPVGVATQDPRLRKKFAGKPEHVINYFFFVAEEIRRLLAEMGFTRLTDIIGRRDLLRQKPQAHWKATTLDLSAALQMPQAPAHYARHHCEAQDHDLPRHSLDYQWREAAAAAIERGEKTVIRGEIRNVHRTVGTVLSSEVARRHGHGGMPDSLLEIHLRGVAGQSFGAFVSRGIALHLRGEANDYFGKGLSGGLLSVAPPSDRRDDSRNIIIGNTAFYGAVSGAAYCRGIAGERFAVRNSGAQAVVEGCGDHGCEYMTGGLVVVLGAVGRNFAAGMSGGVAFVLDEGGDFRANCNTAMVDVRGLEDADARANFSGVADDALLRGILGKHLEYTSSPKARRILADWAAYAAKFVKVMPFEYEQALAAMAKKRA